MAWNPSPEVAAARDYAEKFNKDSVIIISVAGESLDYASYGKNKRLCDSSEKIADVAFNAIIKYFEGK